MDEKLILFLRNIADSIEKKQLNEAEMFAVGEFYMSYHFQKEIDKVEDIDEKDFLKFLILGWYIYYIIQKNNQLSIRNKLL